MVSPRTLYLHYLTFSLWQNKHETKHAHTDPGHYWEGTGMLLNELKINTLLALALINDCLRVHI